MMQQVSHMILVQQMWLLDQYPASDNLAQRLGWVNVVSLVYEVLPQLACCALDCARGDH